MTSTLILLALGMILLATIVAIVVLRDAPPKSLSNGGRRGEFSTVLTALELNLPSQVLADRIFSQKDLELVMREAPSRARAFRKDRTRIAILWLDDTRLCVARLFQFYRITVRGNADLDFWTELRVAGNYLTFLTVVIGLRWLVFLRGPFYAQGLVARLFRVTDGVSAAVERTLAILDPLTMGRIRADWARRASSGGQ
jgi:hypothetical protein